MARTSTLPTALHQLLFAAGKQHSHEKGQIIQTTSDQSSFNLIKSGFVKRYLITNDGSLGIEAIYGPGDVFSLTLAYKALLDQDLYEGPETYYFETMCECETYTVDIGMLQQHFGENPLLYKDLMIESGKRMHTFAQAVENIAMKSAYNRTAHQLLYYARQFGRKRTRGIEICVPLTHQDVANVLSLTRETISLNFTALRKKGLIRTGKLNRIYVLDIDKLEEEAYN